MSKWLLPGWILILTGCQGGGPLADPFSPYGMRVVPPPATGSIGTPSGYAQPPASLPPSLVPPGSAPLQTIPGQPNATLAPPQTSAIPGEGNWQSIAQATSSDLGLAPPVRPRNPYAQEPSFAGPPPMDGIARASAELNWRSTPMPATSSPVAPAYYDLPTTIAANVPPSIVAPTPTSAPDPGVVYIPPVRPSVVRSVDVAPSPYQTQAPIPGDAMCCDPVADPGGVLVPTPDAVMGASPNQWQPRR